MSITPAQSGAMPSSFDDKKPKDTAQSKIPNQQDTSYSTKPKDASQLQKEHHSELTAKKRESEVHGKFEGAKKKLPHLQLEGLKIQLRELEKNPGLHGVAISALKARISGEESPSPSPPLTPPARPRTASETKRSSPTPTANKLEKEKARFERLLQGNTNPVAIQRLQAEIKRISEEIKKLNT